MKKSIPPPKYRLPPVPAFLPLISIYPVLFLWASKPTPHNTLIALVISLIVAITAVIIYYYFLSIPLPPVKSAVLATLIFLFLFSYGAFSRFLGLFTFGGFTFSRHLTRAPLYLIISLPFFLWLILTKKNLSGLSKIADLVWKVLYAFILAKLLITFGNMLFQNLSSDVKPPPIYNTSQEKKISGSWPDVYYIILDGYARADTFHDLYGTEPSLTAELKKRGFFVAEKSFSNYAMTVLSIPSSMSMNYLKPGSKAFPESVKNLFIQNGYSFIDIDSIATLSVLYGTSEFLITLLRMSFLDVFSNRLGLYSTIAKKRTLNSLEQLAKLTASDKTEGGRFIFAHILCPHPPYVFSYYSNSKKNIDLATSLNIYKTSWDDYRGYYEQAIFIGEEIIRIVDRILADSRIKPFIIIQSDHGPKFNLPYPDNIKSCMRILNAYYFPDSQKPDALKDDISPVNTFRIIANNLFKANYPTIENSSFYSNYSTPYIFSDVTHIINTPIANRYTLPGGSYHK